MPDSKAKKTGPANSSAFLDVQLRACWVIHSVITNSITSAFPLGDGGEEKFDWATESRCKIIATRRNGLQRAVSGLAPPCCLNIPDLDS